MDSERTRASDRIEIEVPIEVLGTDCMGVQFFDRTQALVIGRHGGKVLLERKLVPQQEITVRCLATGREAEARVVGQIANQGKVYHYGIKFLDERTNIWGVEFPPVATPVGAAGGALLECIGCKNRELVYLDEFEIEVLEANGQVSRACNRCRDVSLWQKAGTETLGPGVAASAPSANGEIHERRREPRRRMDVRACVRTARFGEDVVKVRNVSRRGLSFASPWVYVIGQEIEVAVPFSPSGGNLFFAAKIVRVELLASEATRAYGVAYERAKS
jgi:hypothetical protein